MRRVAFLFVAILFTQPADAGCFLFFCSHRHHHHARHHHHFPHHQRPRVVHKTIVKKVIIVREPKTHKPAMDRTPITPLK